LSILDASGFSVDEDVNHPEERRPRRSTSNRAISLQTNFTFNDFG